MSRARYGALITLGLTGAVSLVAVAYDGIPRILRTERVLQKDSRVAKDRLHSKFNANHEDDLFLDAVGAVWPYAVSKSAAVYDAATGHDAATGFLVDRCHVLTNMHVVYPDATVVDPPLGKSVAFAVGQTEGDKDRGALQGLKYLLQGTVVAHGEALILDHVVHNPDNDWAVIQLAAEVEDTITPMTIDAVDFAQVRRDFVLSAAGFPTDHRGSRGDGFRLKDLWGSDGQLVEVVSMSTAGALIQTTIQTTPGNSGSPVYGDFNGHLHVVVGMVQGIQGNGINASASMPNIQVLFTPGTLAKIIFAEAQTPCR